MSTAPIKVTEQLLLGSNGTGYTFAVGQVGGGRWIGYALGDLEDGGRMMFVFPEIAEGVELGMLSRDEAIRRVCLLADDPSYAYGVTNWYIPEALRGTPRPEDRCPVCDELFCEDDHSDFDPEALGP